MRVLPRSSPVRLPVVVLLLVPALAGCFGASPSGPRAAVPADVGYDPAEAAIHVTNITTEPLTLLSWDGQTHLAAVVYVPHTTDTTPTGAMRWPLVVFAHGWGNSKESYEGKKAPGQPDQTPTATNRLQQVAQAGFVVIAYDARGFGQSEGTTSVAGPAEVADLHFVIEYARGHYATSDKVGVIGASYGGGQAMNAWANDPLVTTAVSMYGWNDLYGALLPGDVPKLEWAQFLYGYGLVGARARYDPMIHDWYTQLYTRSDLPSVHRQMDERSVLAASSHVSKPLFVCQGMQETLFPQIDAEWHTAGFVRAYLFTGGHGADNDGCMSRAIDWFRFFLAGYDTRVDQWPALETVDADGTGPYPYAAFPTAATTSYHLRLGELVSGPATDASFTIDQRLTANPLAEPSAIWDPSGLPRNPIPAQLQQDPAAVFFASAPVTGRSLILGAPTLTLHLVGDGQTPFQVAGTLYRLKANGDSVLLGRAAVAPLDSGSLHNDTVTMNFPWTRAQLMPGDSLQLKLAANDPDAWVPLFADYSAKFDGASRLDVPLTRS